MSTPNWGPAETHIPSLLGDLMHMDTLRLPDRQVIEQYKHIDTRRYINLDEAGQAWQVAVVGDEITAEAVDLSAAIAFVEGVSA